MHAIILAGGKGERLRPLTVDRPKPMVEVLGVPILAYQVQWLQSQGVTDITISCGYRHEVIVSYFGDGSRLGVRITYAIEDEPLGRGGGIKHAWRLAQPTSDVVIATNGDIITNLDLGAVLAQHRASGVLATLVLAPFVSPYGIVDVDEEDRVRGFREKPELPYWINAGIYILSRELLDAFPDRGDHETTTFPDLARRGLLGAYRSRSYWRAVDTIKDHSEVSRELQERLLSAVLGRR
jgi:NDP-sugar pyrophosphorylase family protein